MPAHQADSQQLDAASARLPVDVRRLPWIRKLAADYAFDFGGVAPFFSGNPADPNAWASAISRARAHRRDRRMLTSIVAAQQERRGAPEHARRAGASLADSSVAVVTGQQAGLFGGPLFTLFKAITALKLADRVTREHGVSAVAVFWVEAEDHDWDEVRASTVLDETLAPRSVALPRDAVPENTPIGRVTLDSDISRAVDELAGALPATEFRESLLADLRTAYAPGVRMADAFASWLERVLGDRGLVVYDASDPTAKPLAADVFARELRSAGETARRAASAGAALRASGYHAQVQAAEGSVALFHVGEARRPLRRQDGRFIAGDTSFDDAALVREAAAHPQTLSPNVLLRPIVQDTIFPTVCYVAGPNELAYLAQLKSVYEHFGVPMPLIHPRASATLLDSAAMRFLHKYSIALESLQRQDEAALNELLKAQIPPEIEASFAGAQQSVHDSLARVSRALGELDPTLEGAASSTLSRMQHDLESLHGKTIQAAKRRDETLRRQFLRTRALAFPGGDPQERAVGFVSFLNQYGPALVDGLWDELPLDPGYHWVVSI